MAGTGGSWGQPGCLAGMGTVCHQPGSCSSLLAFLDNTDALAQRGGCSCALQSPQALASARGGSIYFLKGCFKYA